MPTTVSFERPKTMMFMSDQRMEYHGLKQTVRVIVKEPLITYITHNHVTYAFRVTCALQYTFCT